MRLVFRQRFFSWFDSFDITDEMGNVVFRVQGQLSWGHMFKIFDNRGRHVGTLKERVFSLLHTFDFDTEYSRGSIQKNFTFFNTSITVNSNPRYEVEGNFLGWDYTVYKEGIRCAIFKKEIFNFTDTYSIDCNPADALTCVLILLAIDAIKCDHKNND